MTDNDDVVTTSVEGGVLVISLDRLDADAGLRVGVLFGVGPGFSAGRDLKALALAEKRSPRWEGR